MDAYSVNREALSKLSKGEIFECQTLLKKARSSKDYRSIHNLGVFYIENGMTLKNGKLISGFSRGIRLIEKAYQIKRNSFTAQILAQNIYNTGDIIKALNLYSYSNEFENSDNVRYNVASCLYELGRYEELLNYISAENSMNSIDTFLLYCFTLWHINREDFRRFLSKNHKMLSLIDEPDLKLLLLYFSSKSELSLQVIEKFTQEWYLDEYMWAVIIDSLFLCGMNEERVMQFVNEESEGYSETKKLHPILYSFVVSPQAREEKIESTRYFRPIIREKCGYFGCELHGNKW